MAEREPKERQQKAPCPYCGHWDSRVIHGHSDGDGYIRRRQCLDCGQRFNTLEQAIRKYQWRPQAST